MVKSNGTTLFLMRHAQTYSNADGGWPDENDPLSAEGIRQVEEVSAIVQKIDPDVIISSNSRRASQTAQLISRNWFDGVIEYDPRFREIDGGELKGMSHDDIKKKYGSTFAESRAIPQGMLDSIFGAEKILEFAKRVQEAISYIKEKWKDKRVLLVTHGGFIRLFFEINQIQTFEDEEYFNNCSIAGFRETSGTWSLIFRFNAYNHYIWDSDDYRLKV